MELEDKMEQARKVLAELSLTLKAGESKMEEEITSPLKRRVNDLDFDEALIKDEELITMATLRIDKTAVERVEQELSRLGQLLHEDRDPQKCNHKISEIPSEF
nr:hypothetical protein BaRGS_010600 [Batillaria attramentaria]